MDGLALSNDYTALLKETERLRAVLSSKILERDNLVLIECKNLSVKYYTTIGVYEYKVFEKYCAIQRIKRKIELIQMYLNRNAEVFIAAFKKATEIVEQYRRDLSEWERKVKSNQAPDRHSPPPEKQSVRNRLRQLQAESKQRRTHNRHSQDRER